MFLCFFVSFAVHESEKLCSNVFKLSALDPLTIAAKKSIYAFSKSNVRKFRRRNLFFTGLQFLKKEISSTFVPDSYSDVARSST